MEEPTAYQFDEFHDVIDESTGEVYPPLGIQHRLSRSDYKKNDDITQTEGPRRSALVHSVLLAGGIHNYVTEGDLEDLPDRFDAKNVKARFTWFGTLCLAGVGMFIEAYVIITTGQVKTIWYAQYPECWKAGANQACPNKIACCGLFPNTPDTCVPLSDKCNADGTYPSSDLCPSGLLHSISYAEFVGIMLGMLTFGRVADMIGKVRAGILTCLLMILGITFMAFFTSDNDSTIFLVFSVTYGVFGWGVGGEYPLTAMSAASHHVEEKIDALDDDEIQARHRILLDKAQTARRGETISLVFAMQGVGSVIGSAYLLFLLYFSGQGRSDCDPKDLGLNSSGSDPMALNAVWRSFYLLGGTFCVMILLYRTLVEEHEQGRHKLFVRKERRKEKHGEKSTWQILKFYGPRLIGTGGSWFVLDVAFYGLKLFSGPIFSEINPSGDLIVQNGYLLIYNLCGMLGYYCAAFVVDQPKCGRKRFQMVSFLVQTLLFFTSAAVFDTASPAVLIFLYFLSNFTSTFGVNSTVHVMAAETYPHEVRGTCHGLSAFCGKLGALLATIVFGMISVRTIFFICGAVSAAGVLFTYVFCCDLTRVSLAEHDAQLELFFQGRPEAYKGKLNAAEHLSNYEIWSGQHGEYDPDWARKLISQTEAELLPDEADE